MDGTDTLTQSDSPLRPEDMVPYVREYLGLLDEKKVLETEYKRIQQEFKDRKRRIVDKMKPLEERFYEVEGMLKQLIMSQKLPGVKYKQFIFTLEEKPVYKPPMQKIKDALEKNPIEHYQHNKQALAQIIADAMKRKVRDNSYEVKNSPSAMCLKIRILDDKHH
jgi:hypothetical protein